MNLIFWLAAGLSACTCFSCSRFCKSARGLIPIAPPVQQNLVAAGNRVPLQSLPVRSATNARQEKRINRRWIINETRHALFLLYTATDHCQLFPTFLPGIRNWLLGTNFLLLFYMPTSSKGLQTVYNLRTSGFSLRSSS